MNSYPRLFEPFQMASMRLANRIVMLPHGTGMLSDGKAGADDDAYFEARARAGVGLVIAGGLIVHESSVRRARKSTEAYREEAIATLRHKASVVQRHGVPMVGQLLHLGRESVGGEFEQAGQAPSPVRSPRDPYPPHELDADGIASIVAGFRAAAANCRTAGLNGVEIHAAHGYLVAQFLSPATNFRTDAYGGDDERRFRFLREIIEAVRDECGRDFVLGLRLSADEELADGNGIRDTLGMVDRISALDAIDYLSITIGVRGAYVKDVTWPHAPAAHAARLVRSACSMPVIVGQRITDPATAERLLAEGVADLVGMARSLIADAEWPAKSARGEAARIRPCVGLLQDCRNHAPHLHCAVNPLTGREADPGFRALVPAPKRRRIAVVGGGPAGMEAARIAADRGHEVSLFEASDGLGGQFLHAASLPGRQGLTAIVDHLAREMRGSAVTVELGVPINRARDLGTDFDAAVVATGAGFRLLAPDMAARGAVSCFHVLEQGAPAPAGSGRALVVDDGTGFWWTFGVAELLSIAGWRVTIAVPGSALASAIPPESLGPLLARLGRGGTEYRVCMILDEFGDGAASLLNVTSGAVETIACDLVVIQTGRAASAGPAHELRQAGMQVEMIGDSVAPRRISHALLEAQRVARAL